MARVPDELRSRIKDLPDTPGVYEFLDSRRRIIYVGKARKLKRRVASYFRAGRAMDSRTELMVSRVRDIKFIRTSSEAEALIYEAGLIKDHKPKFNVELKDDKSYPFLKLTVGERYPRLLMTRRRIRNGAVYYGPYVNVKLLREALSFMKRVFPLRSCRRIKKSVCLEYDIGQCAGPCEGKISDEEYNGIVEQLKKFLEGKKDDLIGELEKEMSRFTRRREYESSISVKKRIEALTAVRQLHDRSRYPMYGELDELRNALLLSSMPAVIECFDISDIGGRQAVGAMVRFVAGIPRKSEYRRFRIRSVKGIDDYSMIREAVKRRYLRLLEGNKTLPDLVLVDGGKGHLFAARDELRRLGIGDVPVASITKEYNHLYSASRAQPIRLSPGSRLLLLVQRIRDEAHRFAVAYHRKLRRTEKFDTELRRISGVGPVREKALLEKFGGVSGIRKASMEDLLEAGIDRRTARAIAEYFRG